MSVTTVRFPDALWARMRACKHAGVPDAHAIREAVTQWCERQEAAAPKAKK